MKKKAGTKTNAMRHLDEQNIPYEHYDLHLKEAADAVTVANALGRPVEAVFKTLVTESNDHEHFVFMIPAAAHLSLKKAAKAAGKKSVSMIAQKQLLPLTGYVHGGCSPFGMKKSFATFIDQSAQSQETILFSGGKIGVQIEANPGEIAGKNGFCFADLTEE